MQKIKKIKNKIKKFKQALVLENVISIMLAEFLEEPHFLQQAKEFKKPKIVSNLQKAKIFKELLYLKIFGMLTKVFPIKMIKLDFLKQEFNFQKIIFRLIQIIKIHY